jgi:hypothetical protein
MFHMHRGVIPVALLLAAFFISGATALAGHPVSNRLANVQRVAVPGTELAPAHAAVGSANFADPASDSGAAPDVTTVSISNDDEGLITFRISVPNRTSLGPDEVIAIPLGTDDPDVLNGQRDDGMNFILGLAAEGAFLLEWDGETMVDVDPQPGSVTGSFAGGVAAITVRQEDLAPGFPDVSVPISLNFYVLGILFNGTDVLAQDDAPDGTAVWSYRLAESLRLIVTNFDADKTIKAGKTLVVLLGVAHGDTGAALKAGKVACKARVGKKALKGSGRFFTLTLTLGGQRLESPSATCSWKIPKTAKKKTVTGSVAVTESGITVKRAFSTKVR